MFDWKKPTVQMLGRWQPWHEGHQALFKRCVAKTGQVIIQVRDVQGASGGDGQDDNPFDWDEVCSNIEAGLLKDGFKRLLASIDPPLVAPAPITVCISSINKTDFSCFCKSFKTAFNLSSKSPLYLVPARSAPISKE